MTPEERFWRKVDVRGPDECWEWRGHRNEKGYGRFWTGERNARAHRHAYELKRGAVPEGKFVCHSCDTPGCCNPAHLWLGTNSENMQDSVRKGRHMAQRRPDKVHSARLTVAQVLEIRARLRAGEWQKKLAAEFGVKHSAVRKIARSENWGWVGMFE